MEAVNLNPTVAPVQPVQPVKSGGTFIYVIVVIMLLVSLVAAGFFFYKSQSRTVIDLSKLAGPSPGPSSGSSPGPSSGSSPGPSSGPSPSPQTEDDSNVNVEPLDTDPMSTTENYTSF